VLAFLALVIALLDKTTGRILAHTDKIREIVKTAGFDLISLFAGWENSKLDVTRKTELVEFEARVLTSIDASKAIEMLIENRRLMQ
jgi:hypothetical protein